MTIIKDKKISNRLHSFWKTGGCFFLLFFSLPFGEGWGGASFAQQLPFSSQYYTNPLVINPAYTGIDEKINVFLTHRSQWTGLAGAPQTSYFTIDGPIQVKNSSLGLKIYSDVTDIIGRTGAFTSYAYKLAISDSNTIYFGIAGGVINNKIDFSKALIRDNDDPFLSQQSQNRVIFSADLGVVYVWKKLTVGFAVPQVLGNTIKYPILNGDESYYNLNRHYQATAKYVFDVSKEKEIIAYPLVMLRAVKGAPFQYDFNAVIDWKRTGWVGLTFHSNYAFAISGGLRYRNFSVGYAFDLGISKIRSYTGSSSEFLLGYTFGERKKEFDRFVKTDETDSIGSKANADISPALLAQLKAISDTNRAEIDRLKAQLEKAQLAGTSQPAGIANEDLKSAAFFSGKLLDENGNPITDAQIEVIDKATNQVIARPLSNRDGYSRIAVPPGKIYDVVFTKPGYLYQSLNVTIPDSVGYEKRLDNITLQKLEVGKKIVLNNIFFDLNQSSLREESFSELDRSIKLMSDIPSLEIEISGHTDNLGSVKNNQQLSEQRAKAVMDYLVSKGCDKNRLTYKGYGPSQPIADNNTEEGRQVNRRTEFKVLKVDSEYTVVSGTKPSNGENLVKETKSSVAENDELFVQLKTKSDINQAQIDKLKADNESNQAKIDQLLVEHAKAKISNTITPSNNENTALIAQLKSRSDANQLEIAQLKSELEKAKSAETTIATSRNVKDSALRHFLIAETDALLTQLKTKSDTNQIQIDQLKVELEKAKIAGTKPSSNNENDALVIQLKAKSDTNQIEIAKLKSELTKVKESETKAKDALKKENIVSNDENTILLAKLYAKSDSNQLQIDRLKSELEKAKVSETTLENDRKLKDSVLRHFLIAETDALLTQLKTKSDTNQLQIDQLKAELEKTKTAGTKAPATAENDALVAQLKIKSDTNQAQIDRLKVELEKAKTAATKTPATTENDALVAQLKIKSDTNQAQIDQLKAELEKAKTAETKTPSTTENDALVAQLKVKAAMDQAEINRLKTENEKAKTAETKTPSTAENDALVAQLKVKAAMDQAEISRLKRENEKATETTTTIPVSPTPGVRTYKTTDFTDEKNKAVETGFYVVIGAFGNKENAERFKAANIIKGHGNTKIIQNQVTKIYNIFVLKTNNKEDADAERNKYKVEYPSVWILKLE